MGGSGELGGIVRSEENNEVGSLTLHHGFIDMDLKSLSKSIHFEAYYNNAQRCLLKSTRSTINIKMEDFVFSLSLTMFFPIPKLLVCVITD